MDGFFVGITTGGSDLVGIATFERNGVFAGRFELELDELCDAASSLPCAVPNAGFRAGVLRRSPEPATGMKTGTLLSLLTVSEAIMGVGLASLFERIVLSSVG